MAARLRFRSLRSRLSWSASLVVAIWVVMVSIAGNVLLGAVLAREADGVLRARAEATAATVDTAADGVVTVNDTRDDRALDVGTWILAADGTVVERPIRSSDTLNALAARLSGHGLRATDTGGPDPVRMLALGVGDGIHADWAHLRDIDRVVPRQLVRDGLG